MPPETQGSAPSLDAANNIGELAAELAQLKQQTEWMRAALGSQKKPWFAHPSTLIALAALALSLAAALVSFHNIQSRSQATSGTQSPIKNAAISAQSPPEPLPQGNQPAANLSVRVDRAERDIGWLRSALGSQTKPWYRDPSTLISFLALAFSFGTTFVSYHRTNVQDIQASRQELRGILQRMSAIPREEIAAQKQYAGDAGTIQAISQLDNQENSILVRQAAEIARRLRKYRNLVSATEYYAIAVAMHNAYDLHGAKEFNKLAAQAATNFNDEIAAVRSGAYLDFLTGEPQAGRAKYQQALQIFSKYTEYNQYVRVDADVMTELAWANSEAGAGQYPLAFEHIEHAEKLVTALPYSPGAESIRQKIATQKQMIELASSSGVNPPSPPMSGTMPK